MGKQTNESTLTKVTISWHELFVDERSSLSHFRLGRVYAASTADFPE